MPPAFEHHADLPDTCVGGLAATVFMGELAGARSSATAFSPIVGAELTAVTATTELVPLDPAFEHVAFVVAGTAEVAGASLRPGQLLYLRPGREQVSVSAADGARLLLLGGAPLGEPLLMWWNFVARTPEEIAAATADWRAGRFGGVGGYDGDPMAAPPLNVARLRAPRA